MRRPLAWPTLSLAEPSLPFHPTLRLSWLLSQSSISPGLMFTASANSSRTLLRRFRTCPPNAGNCRRINTSERSYARCVGTPPFMPHGRGVVLRSDEQPPYLRPALTRLFLDLPDDALDVARTDVIVEVDVEHRRDLVGRGVDRQHIADAHDARTATGELAKIVNQLRIGRLADQQALGL